MDQLQQIMAMFASFWQMFQVQMPLLGITFAEFYIGIFIVAVSMRLVAFFLFDGGKDKAGRDRRPRRRDQS